MELMSKLSELLKEGYKLLIENNNFDEAIIKLNQVLEIDTVNIDALMALSYISYNGYGEGYQKAIEYYKRVIEIDPNLTDAYLGLALCKNSPGIQMDIDECIEYLKQGALLSPNRSEILVNLGNCYYEKEDYINAKKFFKEALRKSQSRSLTKMLKSILKQIERNQPIVNRAYMGPSYIFRRYETIKK